MFVSWPQEKPVKNPDQHGYWFVPDVQQGFRDTLNQDVECYVECGTWCGRSALEACRLAPNATIYCIDTWCGDGGLQYDPSLANQSMQLTQSNLWQYRDRVRLLRRYTVTGMHALAKAGVEPDVVYIDADHHAEPVRQDVRTAMQLWPEAVICGDDWNEVGNHIKALGQFEHKEKWWRLIR